MEFERESWVARKGVSREEREKMEERPSPTRPAT